MQPSCNSYMCAWSVLLGEFYITAVFLKDSKINNGKHNPLSPEIHIQILQTDLHSFLSRIVERIWFTIKAFSL